MGAQASWRGLGDVQLPPDPQAQYDQYRSQKGQAQINANAQTDVIAFAKGIQGWASGGPKPGLPSEQAIGDMAAATAIAVGGPVLGGEIGAAIKLGFEQAALEAQVFGTNGAPTWALVLASSFGGDVGSAINLAYRGLSALWGGSPSCPTPTPPNCVGMMPPSGPNDPNWRTIQGDCDYVHAAWLLNDISVIEGGDKSQPQTQFWYLFSIYLLNYWTNAINCKLPPTGSSSLPSDRDILYAVAAQWNNTHYNTSQFTFTPVAIDPGHDWFDPPHPTYLEWCLSGGPSGYNMGSLGNFPDGPLVINTGALHGPAGPGTHLGPGTHPVTGGGDAAAPPSTAKKVAVGAAVGAAAVAGGIGFWAWAHGWAYGYAAKKAWEATGGRVVEGVKGVIKEGFR